MSRTPSDGGIDLYRHANHTKRFEVDNYIIKTLGDGKEGDVFASIPKRIANAIFADYSKNKLTKVAACRKLRAALQAVKISNTKSAGDCENEIQALRNLGSGRSHVVKMSDADSAEGGFGWLTIELLAGGSLKSLMSKVTGVRRAGSFIPPDAFGWHLIHNLTTAFLELQSGIVNGVHIAGSARYVHRDALAQNMAFRYPGAFHDYPDLVLIDLGKAVRIDGGDVACLPGSRSAAAQANDVKDAAGQMTTMLKDISAKDPQLRAALERLTRSSIHTSAGKYRNEGLQRLLIELRDQAFKRRETLYKQLQPEISAYFAQEIASDKELLAPMEKLSAPDSSSDSSSSSSPERIVRTDAPPTVRKGRAVSKRHLFRLEMMARRKELGLDERH